jgi:hypothetical protein
MELHVLYHELRSLEIEVNTLKVSEEKASTPELKAAYATIKASKEVQRDVLNAKMVMALTAAVAKKDESNP